MKKYEIYLNKQKKDFDELTNGNEEAQKALTKIRIMEKGAEQRSVVLPHGQWIYCDGKEYEGDSTVVVSAPVERLPYFTRKY